MQYQAANAEEYLNQLPDERKEPVRKLRQIILDNLDEDFQEVISYGMIGYVVPHSVYPAGYHCDPKQPLPFLSLASQKNYIALYHMGMYASKELLDWFVKEYSNEAGRKPDMGKSCLRFKKPENIPYKLIGNLVQKMSAAGWIELYEKNLKN